MVEHPEGSLHQLAGMYPEMRQYQGVRKTEVVDNSPELMRIIDYDIIPRMVRYPKTVTNVVIIGESGIGKGTIAQQLGIKLSRYPALEGELEKLGRTLKIYSVSTGHAIGELRRRNLLSSPHSHYTEADYNLISDFSAEVIANANLRLPRQQPGSTILLTEEFIAVTHPLNHGVSVVTSQAAHDNAVLLMLISNPEIMRRTYRQRVAYEASVTPEDRETVMRRSKTKLDTSADALVETVGSTAAMERVASLVNLNMFNAYREGKIKIPPTVVLPAGFRDAEEVQRQFFMTLTRFTGKDLQTSPSRPAMLREYYRFLAQDEWGILNFRIIDVPNLKNTIHYYPRQYRVTTLDFAQLSDKSYWGKTSHTEIVLRELPQDTTH